jgi:hypothetical protein
MGATWAIALLAREPAALVMANLRWHIAQGARELHLYLDDPFDPVAEQARALPGVRVTLCDAAFWSGINGARPPLQTRRQTLIATQAYARTGCDWLVHLDADEFLWVPDLAAQLARCPHDMLHIPVAERVWTRPHPQHLLEGGFRAPRPGPASEPAMQPYFNRGMSGHAAGKSASRTGRGMEILPHMPRLHGQVPPSTKAQEGWILHFDGLTPLHYLRKMLAYRGYTQVQRGKLFGAHRLAQIERLESLTGDAQGLDAFMRALKWGQAGDLMGIDLAAAMGITDDLTCADFDAALSVHSGNVVENWRTRKDSNL